MREEEKNCTEEWSGQRYTFFRMTALEGRKSETRASRREIWKSRSLCKQDKAVVWVVARNVVKVTTGCFMTREMDFMKGKQARERAEGERKDERWRMILPVAWVDEIAEQEKFASFERPFCGPNDSSSCFAAETETWSIGEVFSFRYRSHVFHIWKSLR